MSSTYKELISLSTQARAEATGQRLPPAQTRYFRTQFQSSLAFGAQSTVIVPRASQLLTAAALVLDVSAIAAATGNLAYVEDATNFIQSLTISCNGQDIVSNLDGRTLSLYNQVESGWNTIQGLEASTGLNASFATRRANAAAGPQKFIIPLFMPSVPLPVSLLSSDLTIKVQFYSAQNCIEGGGTLAATPTINPGTSYLLTQWLETIPGMGQQLLDQMMYQRIAAQGGLSLTYRDPYAINDLPVNAGATSATLNISSLRGLVQDILVYGLAVADTGTALSMKPTDFIPIDTVQFRANGLVFPEDPLQQEIARYYSAPPRLSALVAKNVVPIPLDAANVRPQMDGALPAETSAGGRYFGAAGSAAASVSVQFPAALGANSNINVVAVQWNALQFRPSSASGMVEVTKLVN